MALSEIEKGVFMRLFNRGGYVLDFSTGDFDVFTYQSVGVALCKKYEASKGKSLMSFIHDGEYTATLKDKLLFDLLDHYEFSRLFEEECGEYALSNGYKGVYKKCRELYEREHQNLNNSIEVLAEVSKDIDSAYIDSQIELIKQFIDTNPTVAIGKCKELVETITKHILEKRDVPIDSNVKFPKLVRECMKTLGVLPDNISDSVPASETLKTLLNNLASISNSIAELRNHYGDGHGKSSSFVGLQPRHAKLALGASTTLITFLWETYKLKESKC